MPPRDNIPIPSPTGDLSPNPDEETKKGLDDWTGMNAGNRVLFINLLFIRYGTDDKQHAAAVFLSVILLIFNLIVTGIAVAFKELSWAERVLSWSGSAFLLTSGVAIGQKVAEKSEKN